MVNFKHIRTIVYSVRIHSYFKIIAFNILFSFLGLPCILAQAPINNDCANASSVTIGSGGFGLGTYTSTQFDISAATLQTGETFAPSV